MREALLALTLLGCSPDKPDVPASSTQAYVEVQKPNIQQVSLGNIDFIFGPDSGFTDQEKILVKRHMESAYSRLSQTLGDETLQFMQHTEVRVYKKDKKEVRGSVQFADPTFTLNDKLEPELQNKSLGTIELFIGEISEPNLAHEFTHLFAQSSYFLSEAFSEGMVYGLTEYLYPTYYSSMPDFYMKVIREKCVATVFEHGLDYDNVDIGFGGGVDAGLEKLLHSQWIASWGDFIREHPEFPKSFFGMVLEERKKGKLVFSRDELWDMAKRAEPDFEKWHASEEGASVRPIEQQTAFYMVVTGQDQFSVLNLTASPRSKSESGLRAGSVKLRREGKSSFLDPVGKDLGEIPTASFLNVTVPNIPEIEKHSVAINGTTIPFVDRWSCETKK